jgi:phosphinothricin acetyltransferase
MLVRHADPRLDAAACAAILAPSENEAEMRHRIAAVAATHCWLVAEDASGAVVGFAFATPYRGRAAQRSAAETSAYVEEKHRRSGTGRALYTAVLGYLQRHGVRVVHAAIEPADHAAVAFHESLGFTPAGEAPGGLRWWRREL